MKTAIIWLVVGMIIQGLYMQWRFTGTFFSNEVREESASEFDIIKGIDDLLYVVDGGNLRRLDF